MIAITLLDNFPVVTAKIDGSDVPLIVDTGNPVSVALTQTVIDRVKPIPTGETSRGMDPKGNILEYPRFRFSRVEIGTAVFTDVVGELDVHDRSYQATQVGQEGFLGTALLKSYKVVFDYPHQTMTLIAPDGTKNHPDGCEGAAVSISARWHGEPATEIDIDLGRLVVWWDTGAPTSMLSRRFAQTARPNLSEETMTSKRFAVAGTDFGPLAFVIEDLSLPVGFDGFIGHNFFAHHIVCMDFPRNRVLVRKPDGYVDGLAP